MRRPGTLSVPVLVLVFILTPAATLAACAQDEVGASDLDPPAVALTSTSPGSGAIDALAATADGDGRVQAVFAVGAVTPLGGGLARVDASWQGRPLSGLIEGAYSGLDPDHLRVEGTVVAARGVSAFVGVAYAADGTSNTVMFLATGAHLDTTEQFIWTFSDVLVSSLTLHSVDHRLWTTTSGAPFAAAVILAPPDATVAPEVVTPRDSQSNLPTGELGAQVTVVQTPLGPIGTVSGTVIRGGRPGPAGIIAVLIGL